MITLYGATGYTGGLIAAVLEREGLPYRLAGRSSSKLAALSQALASHPNWICADVSQPSTLPPLFKDTHLLINCAGPFTDLGERVISMAAVLGVHYLDTTNELGYVYRAQTYQQLAQKSNAALVPACAFEVALADCAAALLAQILPGPYQSVDIVYHLPGKGASRGTRLSALRSLATSWISYRGGQWTGEVPGLRRKWFHLAAGRTSALSFPSSDCVTIPNHLQVQQVATWMTGAPLSTFFAPILVPLFARFLRSLPGRLVLWAAGRAPSAGQIRTRDGFEIQVSLENSQKTISGSLTGFGPYEITAEIIVYAARKILEEKFSLSGVLPPAGLLNPSEFIRETSRWGIKWETTAG
jgi:short subunit dehydrogenase-like uncharacterized protein